MIKNYLNLNEAEKKKLYLFINRNKSEKEISTVEEIEEELLSEVYDYGKGVLVYLENGEVYGKASVVLEVAEVMSTAYVHSLALLEDLSDRKQVLAKILDEPLILSKNYKAEKVLLGIRNDELLKIANELGLYSNYLAYKMILKESQSKVDILELIPLTDKNTNQYIEIYNGSFMDMPHGTYIDMKEAKEYLEKQNKDHYYFMVKSNNDIIGFLNCNIDGDTGEFDIGLIKEYRGNGLGKKLLETAISFLKDKVENIELIVIEKNSIAFNMYKKRGFEIKHKISDWIVLK